jgi:hypothetical protein
VGANVITIVAKDSTQHVVTQSATIARQRAAAPPSDPPPPAVTRRSRYHAAFAHDRIAGQQHVLDVREFDRRERNG